MFEYEGREQQDIRGYRGHRRTHEELQLQAFYEYLGTPLIIV
jgi:hypothetical protein